MGRDRAIYEAVIAVERGDGDFVVLVLTTAMRLHLTTRVQFTSRQDAVYGKCVCSACWWKKMCYNCIHKDHFSVRERYAHLNHISERYMPVLAITSLRHHVRTHSLQNCLQRILRLPRPLSQLHNSITATIHNSP